MFHVIWHNTYIICHIPPCIPWALTRCSRSGAKNCIPKAMASLENNSAWVIGQGYVRRDKFLQLLVKTRNRDSRDSGFSSSCCKAATQIKYSPLASFILDLMMPVCACISNDVMEHYAWSQYQLWIDAESSDDAVPSKCGTGLDVLRMHCTTEVYVFIM